MKKEEVIDGLTKLGEVMVNLGEQKDWEQAQQYCSQELYEATQVVMNKQFHYNGWFTKESVCNSLKEQGKLLTLANLTDFTSSYAFSDSPKKVGVIMAGNIPLVGFHDFICVLLSGNSIVIKLSSEDTTLLPKLIEILVAIQPEFEQYIKIPVGKIGEIEAIIATGSNNSMRYFEEYFGKYPHLFRKNRTSIALLDGTESDEELTELGSDLFTYFGLGCRNVSQLFIPKDFKLDRIFGAILPYSHIVNHHKYANNYDYNKAVHLLNLIELLDNGFVLLKESKDLHSPLAMVLYHRYESVEEAERFIAENEESIQAIVGHNYLPFGVAQKPTLTDFADNVDTMAWLNTL